MSIFTIKTGSVNANAKRKSFLNESSCFAKTDLPSSDFFLPSISSVISTLYPYFSIEATRASFENTGEVTMNDARSVARFTETSAMPSTLLMAFSTRATQLAQVIPSIGREIFVLTEMFFT